MTAIGLDTFFGSSDPTPDQVHDLIIVGAGPVGLTMAAVWGQLGRSAVVVEKHVRQYGLPRAGHIDHEIMRLLQSLDAEGPTLADSYETEYYRWVNAHGETLIEFPWGEHGVSGWHSDFMQNSAILEASLLARVKQDPLIDLMGGWQLVRLVQHTDHVELTVEATEMVPGDPIPQLTGRRRILRGRYLVAADGANSQVRRWLQIPRQDLGFNEKWLVVDARRKTDFVVDFDSGQICDPRRPTTVLPLGKDHRRWEWHIAPTEDPADFQRPEKVWELLAALGIGPDDVEPVRQLVYTFEARVADHWRDRRVFLTGDAAHTMPPFMGQGMCSGMRDAKNLAWKLDLVLGGAAGAELLDSYQAERAGHVQDWTVISLESGKLTCVTDPEEARIRDDAFRAGYRPPVPQFPQLSTGILAQHGNGAPLAPAGELGLQARVRFGDRVDLFDRLLPSTGFTVIALGHDPSRSLGPGQLEALTALGARLVELGPVGSLSPVVDVDGSYAAWMRERGITTVVVRPDFYVFGGAAAPADLPALIDDLVSRLGLSAPAFART